MPMKNPPHPGRLVKSALDDLGVSIAQAADALKVSRSQLNRVISGGSALSPEMAIRLEYAIGSSADAWLRLQAAYDAAQVRDRAPEIVKGLHRLAVPERLGTDQ